jgi:acetolactate synthase-1/2/3 large subunit
MRQRLADYVADFLVERGIAHIFTITGGGAMHLNDAFGHHPKLTCIYNHHEQASAIAAEAYARLENKPAALCVTTGPGGTNALTGVLGAWLDSIPLIVISGQVRYDTTARYNEQYTEGNPLRAVGDQEFDITKAVGAMCKFAVMLENTQNIRFVLEKAYYLATNGRPGPVWIDIPVDFQGSTIETDSLNVYDFGRDDIKLPLPISGDTIAAVIHEIKNTRRPIIYAGNGIRLSGGYEIFRDVVELLGIPVCTYWDSVDLIETDNPLYCGRAGNMGDRPGNLAVQNADLILAIGNRLSIRSVGYNWKTWARHAKVIMVDIDSAELKKNTLHVEMPIHADAREFLLKLKNETGESKSPLFSNDEWIKTCNNWKIKYPVTQKQYWEDKQANVYAVFDYISRSLPENSVTVASNGSCCVVGHQTWHIKKGNRFYNSNGAASMGYGLPAAIGACVSNGRKSTICLEGDGSIMMNLQELQTVVTNNLPIKLFLINNEGYHSIRQTQNNLFGSHSKVGIGPESNDLSFPDFSKIAYAFGWKYVSARTNDAARVAIDETLSSDGYVMCELFVSTTQNFEPKSSTKRLPNGKLASPPLEDLAPFLSREELLSNMFIPLLEEEK